MSSERAMPERREVKRVLRELGMSARQVDTFVRVAWPALVGETQAELDETREALAAIQARLGTSR